VDLVTPEIKKVGILLSRGMSSPDNMTKCARRRQGSRLAAHSTCSGWRHKPTGKRDGDGLGPLHLNPPELAFCREEKHPYQPPR